MTRINHKPEKENVTVELTPEIIRLINLPNSEWKVGQGEIIINHIKKQLGPQPEEIGRGFKFIGLSQDGFYTYSKMVEGKEKIYAVDPDIWEDTKLIFEDALKKNSTMGYSMGRINRNVSASSLSEVLNKMSIRISPNGA